METADCTKGPRPEPRAFSKGALRMKNIADFIQSGLLAMLGGDSLEIE